MGVGGGVCGCVGGGVGGRVGVGGRSFAECRNVRKQASKAQLGVGSITLFTCPLSPLRPSQGFVSFARHHPTGGDHVSFLESQTRKAHSGQLRWRFPVLFPFRAFVGQWKMQLEVAFRHCPLALSYCCVCHERCTSANCGGQLWTRTRRFSSQGTLLNDDFVADGVRLCGSASGMWKDGAECERQFVFINQKQKQSACSESG